MPQRPSRIVSPFPCPLTQCLRVPGFPPRLCTCQPMGMCVVTSELRFIARQLRSVGSPSEPTITGSTACRVPSPGCPVAGMLRPTLSDQILAGPLALGQVCAHFTDGAQGVGKGLGQGHNSGPSPSATICVTFPSRMNKAPTMGFEVDVGSKTTHHLVYPESFRELGENVSMVLVPFKTTDLQWVISATTTGTISQ